MMALSLQDKFADIHWGVWTVAGWVGNAVFTSRFLVQWYATEKRGQVVVPQLFWWQSLVGSLLLLAYALFYDKHHVIIFAYAFSWIPYIRNLIIHRRQKNAQLACPECGFVSPGSARFCADCGANLGNARTESGERREPSAIVGDK